MICMARWGVLAVCGLASLAWGESDVSADSARVRWPLPGQTAGVGYLELSNSGSIDRRLVGVEVDCAERAELHGHEHSGGMMRMRRVKAIRLPSQQTVTLESHGYHIMMFNMACPDGRHSGTVRIKLQLDDGQEIAVVASEITP